MKTSYRITLAFVLLLTVAIALIAQRGGGPQQRDPIPSGSRVQYKSFHSDLVGRDLNYAVYLPPSYEASTKKFPVLYFLHGLNENEMRWSTRGGADVVLDKLVADKKIGEFIVAIPAVDSTSFYTNARGGGAPWEDVVVKEFIPMVESTYRVNATRATRAISGISMGGYGSLKIAMKHPEMFSAVSAHSAALVPSFDSTTVSGQRLEMFKVLFDRIYGINFAGTQDLTYWQANDPLTMAKDKAKIQALQGMKIYFDCGTEDNYGFYDGHKVFDDLLTKASYPHEAHLYPGVHGWDFAKQHIDQSLLFHWKSFGGN
jgi:S-formylglutathione hydrolase FrmB